MKRPAIALPKYADKIAFIHYIFANGLAWGGDGLQSILDYYTAEVDKQREYTHATMSTNYPARIRMCWECEISDSKHVMMNSPAQFVRHGKRFDLKAHAE